MAETIHRMFDSHERASQAAHDLRNHRFDRFDYVYVFSGRSAAGAELSADDIVAEMMKAYVAKAHARVLAQGVQRGGTLVTVHAGFGTSVSAIKALQKHGPIESGLAPYKDKSPAWDEAAPISSLFGWPTLLPDSATFSRFWNVPPLVKSGGTTSAALGLPEASSSAQPFAGVFPMPLLSDKPTPLSSMLGLPLLTGKSSAKH